MPNIEDDQEKQRAKAYYKRTTANREMLKSQRAAGRADQRQKEQDTAEIANAVHMDQVRKRYTKQGSYKPRVSKAKMFPPRP